MFGGKGIAGLANAEVKSAFSQRPPRTRRRTSIFDPREHRSKLLTSADGLRLTGFGSNPHKIAQKIEDLGCSFNLCTRTSY